MIENEIMDQAEQVEEVEANDKSESRDEICGVSVQKNQDPLKRLLRNDSTGALWLAKHYFSP